jgi:hypothetical protein
MIRHKRMARAEALKILELSDWAACDEIEAAYIRLRAQFQSERAGLWRIERLFSEAKSILLKDAGCGSARSSISSLKWRAGGYFANGWQADTPLPQSTRKHRGF